MVGLWKRVRRRALLRAPSDIQLSEYLACFTAGYNRGGADVRKGTQRAEWSPLIRKISEQLATDRSVVEAGCWRAGVTAAWMRSWGSIRMSVACSNASVLAGRRRILQIVRWSALQRL